MSRDPTVAALLAERYGPIPWREAHRQPTPLHHDGGPDTPDAVERRRRVLGRALDETTERRAA